MKYYKGQTVPTMASVASVSYWDGWDSHDKASGSMLVGGMYASMHRWHDLGKPGMWLWGISMGEHDPKWITMLTRGNYHGVMDDYGTLVITD